MAGFVGKQHEMFIAVMGGKYPPPMGAVLASTVPGEKAVLDLGPGVDAGT